MQADVGISAEAYIRGRNFRVGLVNSYQRLTGERGDQRRSLTSAMVKFADITGGRFYWNTNDVGHAVDEIVADSEGTYSLGFYADGEPDDKWHNLDVNALRGMGVKL